MKPYYAMIRIPHGLTLGLCLFQRPTKNKVFKSYRKSKTNIQLLNKLNILQERLNGFTTKSKNNHYEHMANKLKNLQINSKRYWSFLKCFLNNIRIPLVPPLFHKNKFVTNFLEQVDFFNSFFFITLLPNKQCEHSHYTYSIIH